MLSFNANSNLKMNIKLAKNTHITQIGRLIIYIMKDVYLSSLQSFSFKVVQG